MVVFFERPGPHFQQISKRVWRGVCGWQQDRLDPINTFAYMYSAGKFEPGWLQGSNLLARLDLWSDVLLRDNPFARWAVMSKIRSYVTHRNGVRTKRTRHAVPFNLRWAHVCSNAELSEQLLLRLAELICV